MNRFSMPLLFSSALLLCACANDGRTAGEKLDDATEATGDAIQTAGEATIEGMREVDRALSEAIEPGSEECDEEKGAEC